MKAPSFFFLLFVVMPLVGCDSKDTAPTAAALKDEEGVLKEYGFTDEAAECQYFQQHCEQAQEIVHNYRQVRDELRQATEEVLQADIANPQILILFAKENGQLELATILRRGLRKELSKMQTLALMITAKYSRMPQCYVPCSFGAAPDPCANDVKKEEGK